MIKVLYFYLLKFSCVLLRHQFILKSLKKKDKWHLNDRFLIKILFFVKLRKRLKTGHKHWAKTPDELSFDNKKCETIC